MAAHATGKLAALRESRNRPSSENALSASMAVRVTRGEYPKTRQASASHAITSGGCAFDSVECGISEPVRNKSRAAGRNSPPHPRNKEGAEAAHAEASIRRRTARIEATARSTRKMPGEISRSHPTAPCVAQPLLNGASVNRSARRARIKLDLAKRGLVVRDILLHERHQRLGLLRLR